MPDGPRYRIAPSPTGFFHVGGARTALFNWALARQQGGTFVLRIEDTDEARNRPEWTAGIIDALEWLGISAGDPHFEGPYFQSDYATEHLAAAQVLFDRGHAYWCDLTAAQIEERSKASGVPGYDGYSRDRGLGPAPDRVLRFRVPEGQTVVHDEIRGEVVFDNSTIEDFALLRSNFSPMFLLANVVDDQAMGITHVVRGEEHLSNTPKQQMIWDALGHTPPVWAHVPVVVNEERKKLSKRRDRVALEMYRDEGYLAPAMVNFLMTLGWMPKDEEIQPWAQMETDFRLADVTKSPAFFDLKKLGAFNGAYIRMMSTAEFTEACLPYLTGAHAPWPAGRFDRAVWDVISPHVQPRAQVLSQVPAVVDFLFLADPEVDPDAAARAMAPEWAGAVLADTIAAYAEAVAWDADTLQAAFEHVCARHELKMGKAQAPVRVAVTGRTVGPPLFESLHALGRDETLRRLQQFQGPVG